MRWISGDRHSIGSRNHRIEQQSFNRGAGFLHDINVLQINRETYGQLPCRYKVRHESMAFAQGKTVCHADSGKCRSGALFAQNMRHRAEPIVIISLDPELTSPFRILQGLVGPGNVVPGDQVCIVDR